MARVIASALIAACLLQGGCMSQEGLIETDITDSRALKPASFSCHATHDDLPDAALLSSSKASAGKTAAQFTEAVREKYAALMHALPGAVTNLPLYRFIEEWYGVRYQLGGTEKSGIDCSAFTARFYQQVFGFNLLRTALDQCNMSCMIEDKTALKEGDLVFFRINSRRISHVGVYLMNQFFVHASGHGVMISSLNDTYWKKYFAGGGRIF